MPKPIKPRGKGVKEARISLSVKDMAHLYELAYEHISDGSPRMNGQYCPHCALIQERIERFIGPKWVKFVKVVTGKYSYCKPATLPPKKGKK